MPVNLLDDLAEYVSVLSTSMEKTRRAEDRSAYLGHLAAAALIFQHLQQSNLPEATVNDKVVKSQAYLRLVAGCKRWGSVFIWDSSIRFVGNEGGTLTTRHTCRDARTSGLSTLRNCCKIASLTMPALSITF